MTIHRFANPTRFMRVANAVLPWSAAACAILLAVGLYLALFASPADYRQGETVRIMYIHVPAAWMAMFVYGGMAAASAAGLIWKHPLADMAARASAPIGACFTFVTLVSGSLWGQPMWGAWWVWDARLTSMLILFFLYLGYIALVNAFDDPARGARPAAILALVGAVNIPIIKFSVDWWNTQHQPASLVTMEGPKIHASMLWPLICMILAFTLFYVAVGILRLRSEIADARIRNLRLGLVHG
jgi:heme exporter protein C